METKQRHIPKLVLTGGPCAGKTTALEFLAEKLRGVGYFPLIVPEAATRLMASGFRTETDPVLFQQNVLRHVLASEEAAEKTLHHLGHSRPILICDRGVMDSAAYNTPEDFLSLLLGQGMGHPARVRDGRYDAVIHLRSAAIGAEAFFSSASNIHRKETLAEARALDERTLYAWVGHQHLAIVGNTYGDFAGKLEATWKSACRLLGIPEPREIEKKFLVERTDFRAFGVPHVTIAVEQYYLTLPGEEGTVSRVRSWGQENAKTYTFTRKREITLGEVEEREEVISETAFAHYTKYQKLGTVPLLKRRTCFVYNDQYFMHDEFLTGYPGLTLLEIEIESHGSVVELPPFIVIREDVSHKREYFNSAIATVK